MRSGAFGGDEGRFPSPDPFLWNWVEGKVGIDGGMCMCMWMRTLSYDARSYTWSGHEDVRDAR